MGEAGLLIGRGNDAKTAPYTGVQIGAEVDVSAATVSRILKRRGLDPPVGARAGRTTPSL